MAKHCEKCGQQIHDDDFLCPHCGAIWGDRIYRAPQTPAPIPAVQDVHGTDEESEYAEQSAPETEMSAMRKSSNWLLIVTGIGLLLVFLIILLGSGWGKWTGEGGTVPSTTITAPPTASGTTVPSGAESLFVTYKVTFLDPHGTPIPGVRIENQWDVPASGLILPTLYLVSDSNGTISFVQYKGFETDTYVNILSVPAGYDQSMVGYTRYFAEGQTEMLIVLKYSDEAPTEPMDKTYTVQVYDTDGNPVPRVMIENPFSSALSSSNLYLYTDADGIVTFQMPANAQTEPYVKILSVPAGYETELLNVKIPFSGSSTGITIIIGYNPTEEIDPVLYALTVLTEEWLYEPLQSDYAAGETVSVNIKFEKGKYIMLFANGQEVIDGTLMASVTGDMCWEFEFEMPARTVDLRVRAFSIGNWHPDSADLLRAYYRQNPDAADTELLAYYGKYGDAVVGMLNTNPGGSGFSIETIGEYQFYYATPNKITVLVDNEFITLRKAYENGYLTDYDLKQIYDLHIAYF